MDMKPYKLNMEMGDVRTGKIIARSYGSISHLPGSKMIDERDVRLGEQETEWMTVKTHKPGDMVIVTEKIDGMNACVFKDPVTGKLYPLVRKGYDVRTNRNGWIRSFAQYVEDNIERFYNLLNPGERVCGEWMIKQHTLKYKITGEPFITFNLILGNHRVRYFDFVDRVKKFGFEHTGLVHAGVAISTEDAMKLLGSGFHGVVDGKPEGVVYQYYDQDTGYIASGKYVANTRLGNDEFFSAEDDESFNEVKDRYIKYRGIFD